MHQINAFLSMLGTGIMWGLILLAIVLFLVHLRFRETKEDRTLRTAKEKEALAKDQAREARQEEASSAVQAQIFQESEIRRLSELRMVVRTELAKLFPEKVPPGNYLGYVLRGELTSPYPQTVPSDGETRPNNS